MPKAGVVGRIGLVIASGSALLASVALAQTAPAPTPAPCPMAPGMMMGPGAMGPMMGSGMMGGGMMGGGMGGMMGPGTANVPNLKGQHAAYIVDQLNRFASGERQGTVMNRMAASLDDADSKAIAEFLSSTP